MVIASAPAILLAAVAWTWQVGDFVNDIEVAHSTFTANDTAQTERIAAVETELSDFKVQTEIGNIRSELGSRKQELRGHKLRLEREPDNELLIKTIGDVEWEVEQLETTLDCLMQFRDIPLCESGGR